MKKLVIAVAMLGVAACNWMRPIQPNPNETAEQRVERIDRQAEAERRCQAAANRGADRDYDRDTRGCPRN